VKLIWYSKSKYIISVSINISSAQMRDQLCQHRAASFRLYSIKIVCCGLYQPLKLTWTLSPCFSANTCDTDRALSRIAFSVSLTIGESGSGLYSGRAFIHSVDVLELSRYFKRLTLNIFVEVCECSLP
jgi:hypothetical protein